ncbi:MAG TPA: aminoacyl-tRNA hydrolase [Candidatus Saccharimonadales bacterium]|nr:aminoacyl-tRNA hydrolase [Candidatus Saccharimonadales bacterium]
MALFQRRPQSSDPKTFYTVGLNKNILVVGLGNPGKKYDLTRHNAGFICVDEFVAKADEMGGWIEKKNLKCLMSEGRIGAVRVIAIKPATFMNLSGEAVQAVSNFYKIHLDQILVVHDELDIDFGQIRLRRGGSSAGHNGIKSVTQHIGENYGRVRIGIGPKRPGEITAEDFVLQKFSAEEQKQLPNMTREVSAIISEYIYGDQQFPHETRSFII